MKIYFGPAGFGMPILDGLKKVKKLGLEAAECEFTYGVKISNTLAKQAGILAKKLDIRLSVHAPYYINLSSKEKAKIAASKRRILASCERAHHLGAKYVVFHAGFYQAREKQEVYKIIKEQIKDIQKSIKQKKYNVKLAPETTGKESQFGSLDELLKLKRQIGCHLCIDFAHLYARNIGKIDYNEIFKKIKSLSYIHSHFSGITYTQKGERSHIPLTKKFFLPLLKAIRKYKPKGMTIINESPHIYKDAVMMQQMFKK